jgi:protein deglycase
MSKVDEYASDNLPKVLVPIAHGSEEIEAVTIIDTLVRGGCQVVVASVVESLQVSSHHYDS